MRSLPEFSRLLELRAASQFGDGLFQAGLAGALLFNPDRAAGPWAIVAAFAVLFLPYSVLGPFAGALLDRWDRRLVFVGANLGRLVLMLGIAALLAGSASVKPLTEMRDGEEFEHLRTELPQKGTVVGRGLGLLEMVRAIAEDRPHIASGVLGRHVLDIMLSAEESAHSHLFVTVDSSVQPVPTLPDDFDPFASTI